MRTKKSGARRRKPSVTIPVLREKLAADFDIVDEHYSGERMIVFVPSISIPELVLGSIVGIECYEERMLYCMAHLQQPLTHVVFVSSKPIEQCVIEYYANQFATADVSAHAIMSRFTNVAVGVSPNYLSERVLKNTEAVARIKQAMEPFEKRVMMCFAVSYAEEQLARVLSIPLFASRAMLKCGTKSFAREVFEEVGVPCPPGESNCATRYDVYAALARVWMRVPAMNQAVIKADIGVSGISNARLVLERMMPVNGTVHDLKALTRHIRTTLENPVRWREVVEDVPHESGQAYFTMYEACGGGVVEQWMDAVIASPSVQMDIQPDGRMRVLSTYDQILVRGMFKGGYSPARSRYRSRLIELANRLAPVLYRRGGMSNTSVDTVVTEVDGEIGFYAIEINARRGGTTHPIGMAAGVSRVKPDQRTGSLLTPDGRELFVEAHDNIVDPAFVGIASHEVIREIALRNMHFDGERGVIAHLFGTLAQHGKIGGTFIGRTREEAHGQKERFVHMLHEIAARRAAAPGDTLDHS